MEDSGNEINSKKRVRVRVELDSDSDDVRGSKRAQVDPVNSSEEPRVDSGESKFNSLEGNNIGIDILDILDDSDAVTDRDSEFQDLDSVIRSFEEEILYPAPAPASASFPCESQPDLGYLLEASDDELGLPPAISPTVDKPQNEVPSYDLLGLENETPSYDSFAFGLGEETEGVNDGDGSSQFVTLGGEFEYSEASDFSEFLWRPESLPAL